MDFLERLSTGLAGRYRIERELGAGGMATVYLARDLRHERSVALKLLRPELAAVIGAERFLQEIRTTANLQHPHILGLIDSGETEHQLWYVMPFVEGESLRDRLNREKQLPVSQAVRLMVEVAEALDYAHRRGVIHRDIKPENILLHDGRALVADFGIALAASTAGGQRLTRTGLSLGTPAYMSPEQAMGDQTITARSDVYALGCVLYELLTGAPPFTGPTSQAIVATMLTSEPPSLSAQRKTIPPHVEAAVLHALEKLPADRFSSAAEFAAALQNPSYALPVRLGDQARQLSRPAMLLPWALLALAFGFIAYTALRPKPKAAPSPVYRFNVMLPETAAWANDFTSKPALSPDGSLLVYNGRDSTGQQKLFLRAMDRLEPAPIAGSESGTLAFFSPDGRWIGFGLGTRLVKVPVSGGPPQAICEMGGLHRATWLERNLIVFTDRSGLKQCSMTGEVTVVQASGSGELFHHPDGLPGDRGVLFSIQRGSVSQLAVFDLRRHSIKELGIQGSDPRFVTSGHLVYVGPDNRVHAIPFDPDDLKLTGEPVVIDDPVRVEIGEATLAVSRTGTTVIPGLSQQALVLVDRAGRAERLDARTGDYRDPRLSPDGRRVAVRLGNTIWVLDRTQGTLTRLSSDSSASRPVWSGDGKRVAYIRELGTRVDLRVVNADGSTPAESLLALPDKELWEVLYTPDSRSLVVRTVGGEGRRDLWRWAPDSGSRLAPLLTTPANEVSPALSHDGHWLAYASDESGRTEIYVRSFPGMGARVQVSLNGGTEPVWSPAGDELFYRSGPQVLAAAVRMGAGVEVVRRTTLFSDASYDADLTHQMYDVMPDGKRFVMVRRLQNASFLTVTLHRFENLGRTP